MFAACLLLSYILKPTFVVFTGKERDQGLEEATKDAFPARGQE